MAKRKDKKRRTAKRPIEGAGRITPVTAPKDAWLPRPNAEQKRIFYIVSNYTGTGWYRCHVPGAGLQANGHIVVLNHEITPPEVQWADILVFQQSASDVAKNYVTAAGQMGKTTVFELDDDYWSMTPDNPVYKQWNEADGLRLLRECMQLCQVVTTTTPYLAEILGRHHPNVRVLPNMLPAQFWEVPKPDNGDKVVIGWAGGVSHYRDIELLVGTIEPLLDEYPHVEFHVAGLAQYPFRDHERIKVLQSVKVEELPRLLAGFDIGLAPLVDNHFTRCKSDLKYVEYSRVGAAVLASPNECYVHTMIDEENGLFAETKRDWMRQLRRLVEDAELRHRLAAAGKELAISRTIDRNVHLWEEAYGIK